MYNGLWSLTNTTIKFFFLLTPFFVLSMFLSMTHDFTARRRLALALRVTVAVVLVGIVLVYFGNAIFSLFGITLDAFRIGAGILLFLSSIDLARGTGGRQQIEPDQDIAVVPLAIPITVGPATTGALLVMGAESPSMTGRLLVAAALVLAALAVGAMLMAASSLERWVGKRGLSILSKLTGLILAALASQMVLTGIAGFLD